MLQKEFEERTKMQVNPAEYATIERMYMACDNLDKDEFCKLWLENQKKPNGLVKGLFQQVKELDGDIKSYESALNNLQTQLNETKEAHEKFVSDMGDWLLIQSYENDDDVLRAKAIELLGEKEFIIRKLNYGYETSEKDRQLLVSLLTTK